MFFSFDSSAPTEAQLALAPFEFFREPSVILGLADTQEYAVAESESDVLHAVHGKLSNYVHELRDKYPRTLLHRTVLFDHPDAVRTIADHDLFLVPQIGDRKLRLQKIFQEVSTLLLLEFSSYAKSVQDLPSIASPAGSRNQSVQAQWFGDNGTNSRPVSQINESSRSSPVLSNREFHRMSMPVFSSPPNSSSDPTLSVESPTGGRSPAKTFEEMATTHLEAPNVAFDSLKPRPGSVVPSREVSRDRVAVHGFGSDSFSERTRSKGRARVGVVLASVYLQAGRWPDALRESVDSGLKARSYSDHIWYAKALETIMVSMLLLSWSGIDFQVCAMLPFSSDLT
jgi:trafficking protein particle complex subunit 9